MILSLDAETARPDFATEGTFQYFNGNLYYLNKIGKQIKVFDFKSGETIKTIKLDDRGPNSVGSEPITFYVQSEDSIFVYSNFYNDNLSLIDNRGTLLKKYKLSGSISNGREVPNGSVPSGSGSMVSFNGELFISRKFYDFQTLKLIMPLAKLTKKSMEAKYEEAPKLYEHYVERVPQYHTFLNPDITVNEDLGIIVLSYPFDHKLYVSKDGFESFVEVDASSKFLSKNPIILDKGILEYRGNNDLRKAIRKKGIGLLNGYYTNLIYDRQNELYYRIGKIPHNEKDFWDYRKGLKAKLDYPRYFVLTLDENFNVVNENVYSNEFFEFDNGLFLGPDGVWVLNPESENENEMKFQLLKLK